MTEKTYDFKNFGAVKDTLWLKNLNSDIEVGEEATKNVWNIHITIAKHYKPYKTNQIIIFIFVKIKISYGP